MKLKAVLILLSLLLLSGCGVQAYADTQTFSEFRAAVVSEQEQEEAEQILASIEAYQREQENEAVKYMRTETGEIISTELSIAQQKNSNRSTDEDLAEELYCDSLETLAICVMAEAGGEDLEGMRMVADVILNRVDSAGFPDDIEAVITQPYQFTSYWGGGMDRHNVPSEEAYKACQMELEKRSYPGILYYRTGRYSDYGTPSFKHGKHYFSTR